MAKPIYTIAVTGLNAIDSPGPGLAVIRALRAATAFEVRIIGLSYETLEPGIYMDIVDRTFQIPFPAAGTSVLMDRFRYIHEKEKIDFLFPNFDAELFNFIKLENRFEEELGIKMFLPTLDQFEARHKVNLYQYGKAHQVKVPQAEMVFNERDINRVLNDFDFPLVVKGKFYDAKVASSIEQCKQYFHQISAEWGLPVLLQEFVEGTEVNVCGLGDGKGNTIGAVPMRKLYVTDKGKAWAGVTLDNPQLLSITKKLIKESKWRGAFELEFIKSKNDEYYLLEINPRFPAWCYLTVGAGQNQVESLVQLGMGEEVEAQEKYEVGKLFIRFSQDMIVDMSEFEQMSTLGEL